MGPEILAVLRSLLPVVVRCAASEAGLASLRGKGAVELLFGAVDAADVLEGGLGGAASAMAERALRKLVNDADIAQLLTAERNGLRSSKGYTDSGTDGHSVKRLGILMELCARRAYASSFASSPNVAPQQIAEVGSSDSAQQQQHTSSSRERLALLGAAREGGMGVLLRHLGAAVRDGASKRSLEAVEAFVRTANGSLDAQQAASARAAATRARIKDGAGGEGGDDEEKAKEENLQLQLTIERADASALVLVTQSEMRDGIALLLRALQTHAVSTPQAVARLVNCLVALAKHHPAACVALAAALGDDDDDDEAGDEAGDEFDGGSNNDSGLLGTLLPLLLLGRGPARAVVDLLLLLASGKGGRGEVRTGSNGDDKASLGVASSNENNAMEDQLSRLAAGVIRGGLRKHGIEDLRTCVSDALENAPALLKVQATATSSSSNDSSSDSNPGDGIAGSGDTGECVAICSRDCSYVCLVPSLLFALTCFCSGFGTMSCAVTFLPSFVYLCMVRDLHLEQGMVQWCPGSATALNDCISPPSL